LNFQFKNTVTPERKKSLINFGYYASTTMIGEALPFLLLPLLTIYLSPVDYGYINNFRALFLISNALIGGGLSSTISKFFFNRDDEYKRVQMFNLFLILLIIAGSGVLLLFVISFFTEIQLIPEPLFVIIPAISFFFIGFEFYTVRLRMTKQAKLFAGINISRSVIDLSMSLLLVIAFHMNWAGRVTGTIVSIIIMGLLAILLLWKKNNIRVLPSKQHREDILKNSLSLWPHALATVIIIESGKIIINTYLNKAEVGLFSVGSTIAMVIFFLGLSFINTWSPIAYERLAKQSFRKSRDFIVKSQIFIAISLFILSIVLSFVSPWIISLMTTPAFAKAAVVIPWLSFAMSFRVLFTANSSFFVHYGKQRYMSYSTVLGAVVFVPLSIFLTQTYGIVGCAASICITYFLMEIVCLSLFISTYKKLALQNLK